MARNAAERYGPTAAGLYAFLVLSNGRHSPNWHRPPTLLRLSTMHYAARARGVCILLPSVCGRHMSKSLHHLVTRSVAASTSISLLFALRTYGERRPHETGAARFFPRPAASSRVTLCAQKSVHPRSYAALRPDGSSGLRPPLRSRVSRAMVALPAKQETERWHKHSDM